MTTDEIDLATPVVSEISIEYFVSSLFQMPCSQLLAFTTEDEVCGLRILRCTQCDLLKARA